MIGYTDVYGLHFRRFVPLDVGGSLTLAALQSGEIDVAVLFTATGRCSVRRWCS
jgi:osmoprotectant transport system substrate-binding protein